VADLVYHATEDHFTTSNIALQRLTWRLWNELYKQGYTISHSVTLNGTIAEPEPEYRVQTPEELEAERQRLREIDLQMAERSRLRKLASTRADRLLQSHLTVEQRRSLKDRGYFLVVGQSGKRYRIREGYSRNVER
jgi:hypothetical protein